MVLAARRAEASELADVTDGEREELCELIDAVSEVDPTAGEDVELKVGRRILTDSDPHLLT